jgi:hypothetical protein
MVIAISISPYKRAWQRRFATLRQLTGIQS